ncbi:MAG: hypothetical protein LBC75_10920 [Fibromonadaceae bacterium]|jgi:hypothetical protein|nr:hypothetical protein [Fibromonadaceae bacterium]
MVLRFLMLLAFFVLSCANYERDNVHDREAKNFQDTTCGEWNYPKVNELRCNKKDSIVESKCGNGWYDASNLSFRCQNKVVEKTCGSGWYDISKPTIRCQNNVIETKCGNSWYDASKSNFNCQDSVIETRCGDSWYDASKSNLRCQNNVLETMCGSGWYNTSNENLKCQNNVIETKCGNSWYDASTSTLRCQNNIIETRCGNGWYDDSNENLSCQNNVLNKLCDDAWFNPLTDYCSFNGEVTKYNKFTDTRNGKSYKTIVIGFQTWMAENLNYITNSSNCYDDNETNCSIYGRLYNWDKAITVCPRGWRLPENYEWETLMGYLDTDDYGFALLLDDSNVNIWWTATPSNTTGAAYGQKISFEEEKEIYSYESSIFNKSNFFSVRCIMED